MHNFLGIPIMTNGETFEVIILLLIIATQVYFGVIVLQKISFLKNIFKVSSSIEINNESEGIIIYLGNNKAMKAIESTINNYLKKNKRGVVDFHILKDIVDRNVDNTEDEINNKISAPLYLGLAGTMIGIVIGLWSFPTTSVGSDLNIDPLITSVKYAMVVSFVGLLITTLLSIFPFRRAKTQVNKGKNDFLSLLQTDLLPSLIKSEGAAIQELSRDLNLFSTKTPDFIKSLSDNTVVIQDSIENELNILKEINQLDVKKMASSNVEIFFSLSGMMETFKEFPKYYAELNSSLGNTIALNNNLHNLISSTNDVSTILRQVKDIVESGNEATTFFNAHIQSFELYSDSVNKAVATADQTMETAMLQLGEAVQKQFEVFSIAVAEYDSKLTKAFENSIKKFNETYKNSLPKFEKLDHLSAIDSKLDNFDDLSSKLNSFKSLLEHQNSILKDLNITLPSDLNLKLKKDKDLYYFVREGLIILTSVSIVTYVVIQIISMI